MKKDAEPATRRTPDAPHGPSSSAVKNRGDAGLPAPDAGTFIHQYEIIRPLGTGGMGEVLLARDTHLGRLVAIKWLTRHDGESARRFLIEARATAQLTHENIVVIHELGEHGGTPYIVLEYLKGHTLRQWLDERQARYRLEQSALGPVSDRRGPVSDPRGPSSEARGPVSEPRAPGLPPSHAIELMIPVVQALACAHDHGIVHRDLKPSNIMITDGGALKVLDFGVAKLAGTPEVPGETVGTAPYMSPEQWRGESVDHRSDIWAVGMVLAELVLGRHLIRSRSIRALATVGVLEEPMPSVRELRPELGKLGATIERCLIKRKEDRLGSARELLRELEALVPAFRRPAANREEEAPYPGLSAFQPSDAGRFFGRTRATTEVVTRLAEQPLLAIVGPSGAGKSSFVRAGVIPALERTGDAWEAFIVRPGAHPLAALAELLLAHGIAASSTQTATSPAGEPNSQAGGDREGLVATLLAEPGFIGAQLRARARGRRERILVFVDQFEELYTLAPEAERAAFFACLSGVADDVGSPLRALIAIRSDFLDRVADAHAAMTGLGRAITLLLPMDREGLRDALVRPLEALDYRFEEIGPVEEMLDTLENTPAALPLLQFTAAKWWEQRDRARRVLTEASYRHIGGVAGTLSGHAEMVLSAMSQSERQLARTALLRLVTPERTRALSTMKELCELCAAPVEMHEVLGRLIDARLLSVERGNETDATVELAHESLIASWPALSQWVADNQEDTAFVSRIHSAAQQWQDGGQAEGLLWRGQAAEDALRWYARYPGQLAQAEERFLQAAFALADRSRRRRVRIVASVVTLSVIAAAGMSYLAWQERTANRMAAQAATRAKAETVRAQTEALRAQTEAARTRDAIRLAVARAHLDDPTTVVGLLREIEAPIPPPGCSELVKQALDAGVASVVLLGHSAPAMVAAFHPDGRRILSASYDKTVRVWNADGSGAPVVFSGHSEAVFHAAFSPDGRRIASASLDDTVRVWNTDGSGAPIVLRGHSDDVNSVAFSPDGARIVSASSDKTLRVWNADGSGAPLVLAGHSDKIYAAAFSPDGRRIVSASWDKTVRVWNADGSGTPRILRGHSRYVLSASFSPDGTRIVSASGDKTVRVWNADGSGNPLVLAGHSDGVVHAAFSPDGTRIVSSSSDNTMRVWNADGSSVPRVLAGHAATVQSAGFSPDGARIVSASSDRSLRVWNADVPGAPLVLAGHSDPVRSVAFSADGTRIASGSNDKTVRIWSTKGAGAPIVLPGHSEQIYSVAFSPDGRRVASASADETVRVWSADGKGAPVIFKGHSEPVLAVAFSPDGQRIVSASQDKTIQVWNADGKAAPLVLSGHADAVWSAGWSPDGRRIVSASYDKTVRVWNADGSGEPLILSDPASGAVFSAAWSPDGLRIVSGSGDKAVRVWRSDGNGAPLVLPGHFDGIYSVAFSPDGVRIVSASIDKTVRVWNADGSGEPLILSGHGDIVRSATFSPDGTRIASASYDKTVRIWRNLEPVAPGDPRLWRATSYCIPVSERQRLLGMSEELSRAHYEQCLQRVAASSLQAGTASER